MSHPKRRSAGAIGLVAENDSITIDADKLLLQLHVDDSEIAARREKWRPPQRELRGIFVQIRGASQKRERRRRDLVKTPPQEEGVFFAQCPAY